MDLLQILKNLIYKFNMYYENAITLIQDCKKNNKISVLEESISELTNLDDLIDKIYLEM